MTTQAQLDCFTTLLIFPQPFCKWVVIYALEHSVTGCDETVKRQNIELFKVVV